MSSIVLTLGLLFGLSGEWQTFTNTNYINDIAGSDSVLYLATNGGLQVFTVADTTFRDVYTNAGGLPVNVLRCSAQDPDGRVWIGTDGGGLVVFDPATQGFRNYPTDMLPLKVTSLGTAGDTVLVGSDNGAFVILRQGTPLDFGDDQVVQFQTPRVLSNTVKSVGATPEGFWIGTNRGVDLLARTLVPVAAYPRPLGDTVKSIIEYHGAAHLATEWGILRFNGAGFDTVTVFSQSRAVQRLAVWHDTLYVAMDAGLWRFNGGGMEQVWGGDLRAILASNDLWLGFGGLVDAGMGLGRVTPDGAGHVYTAQNLASNNIAVAMTDSGGEVYACHYLTQWGFKSISHRRADGEWEWLRDTILNARSMARDSRNRFWFGHFARNGGVSVYDPADGTWGGFQWGDDDYRNVVCGFGVDRSDTKWTFNQAGSIIAIDSSGQQEVFAVPGVLAPSGGGYDFAFDARGRAWFGTMNGVGMIDVRGTLHDRDDDSLAFFTASTNVPSVAVDAEDRVWIATSQGGAMLENGAFRFYTTANSGILGNDVSRVRVDSWGNVWFLTDKGLSMFDTRNRRWSEPDNNRGLIPNLSLRTGFYTWLDLNEDRSSVLVGTLSGLNRFQFEVPTESSAAYVEIYPNPFIQGVHREVVFDRLPGGSWVQIFTLSGELVAEFPANETYHRAAWEPRRVASGLYVAVVRAGNQRRVYRVALVK
jgi:streptogramin lyase